MTWRVRGLQYALFFSDLTPSTTDEILHVRKCAVINDLLCLGMLKLSCQSTGILHRVLESTQASFINRLKVYHSFCHTSSISVSPAIIFSRHLYFIPSKGLNRARVLPNLDMASAKRLLLACGFSFRGKHNSSLRIFTLKNSGAMAENNPQFNAILTRVREKLRSENVKLWLPPYTTSNDQPGSYPEVRLIN